MDGNEYSPMEGVGVREQLLDHNAIEPTGLLCDERRVRALAPTQTSDKAVLFLSVFYLGFEYYFI